MFSKVCRIGRNAKYCTNSLQNFLRIFPKSQDLLKLFSEFYFPLWRTPFFLFQPKFLPIIAHTEKVSIFLPNSLFIVEGNKNAKFLWNRPFLLFFGKVKETLIRSFFLYARIRITFYFASMRLRFLYPKSIPTYPTESLQCLTLKLVKLGCIQ